ncbi:hypothetical protein ACOMHN_054812 [Nucella lapillus]
MPPVVKDPCGSCSAQVKWADQAVYCDKYELWFHARCVNMRDSIYLAECKQPDVSWYCWLCGLPSFSSELFATVNTDLAHSQLINTISVASPQSQNTRPTSAKLAKSAFSPDSDTVNYSGHTPQLDDTPPQYSTPLKNTGTRPPSFDSPDNTESTHPSLLDISRTSSQNNISAPSSPPTTEIESGNLVQLQ